MNMRMNPTATAAFILIAVFAGGLLTGMLVERAALTGANVAEAANVEARSPTRSSLDREALARDLGLTAEQQARIDEILDEQQRRMREIMGETRPRTRAILKETRARVEEVLTPEQRARWEELHRERHRDRDRNGGQKSDREPYDR
jgi:Spy/CpxP family protein refolding chaperone